MKAVLDTNVWLDLALFEDPSAAMLRAALEGNQLRIIATLRMRHELADVLARPAVRAQADLARARRGLDVRQPDQALELFDAHARLVVEESRCGLICADPDDQCFIDLAIGQRAQWLLSKDRALLRLARRARSLHGLLIGSPTLITAPYNSSA